jgi:hypothetical protein
MLFIVVLASGLETRNPFQNRQEKNEFYFFGCKKIFLTQKGKRASPSKNKKIWLLQLIYRDAWALSIRNYSSDLICTDSSCMHS